MSRSGPAASYEPQESWSSPLDAITVYWGPLTEVQWSLAGIAHGLDALREGGVAPKLLIIDDGWQSTQLDEPLRPITETGAVKSENKVRAPNVDLLAGVQQHLKFYGWATDVT